MKIIFVVQSLDFLISHRLNVCISAQKNGFKIYVAAPYSEKIVKKIQTLGFEFCEIKLSRNGLNVFSELSLVFQLYKLFATVRPDILHLITIKPYLYGGVIARVLNIPAVVSAVSGLGMVFSSDRVKYRVLRIILYPLYKVSFNHNNQKVIFQNSHDCDILLRRNIVKASQVEIIRGSGVDLKKFECTKEADGIPVVVYASRLLVDKGVVVFVQAADILKNKGVSAEFWMVGDIDIHNDNSVSKEQLHQWEKSGVIKVLGHREDVGNIFAQAHIVTLPSFYGEGLPKVLLEASASCRAIITTNHPGCRDAINPGDTGLLVPIKNAAALANSIEYLIKNPIERKRMAKNGGLLAEREFSDLKIADDHLKIFKGLLS